ncbi:MAG TPA: medium chain dehydrogenase/reductase family protein, partial [Ignavibacteria bacterium]|nr:medium chain dehydrogenase/reductase family protein [Ignavibacteria bacterium]
MKAILLTQTGIPSEFNKNIIIKDIDLPEINSNEILVKINSASFNRRDFFIAKGLYPKIKLPVVPGSDCAGIIHSFGKDVNEFERGDEVIINPGINWGSDENFQSRYFKILGMPDNGTFAEYVKINRSNVFKKPEHLDFDQASAIPLAGVTAFRSLFTKAKITENDKVLITGIGGG